MCLLRCGSEPQSTLRLFRRAAAPAGVTGILLAFTACTPNQIASYPPHPGDVPSAYTADARPQRVEIEADGLPAQLAPRDRKPVADDPREPWSPNYGTVRRNQTAERPVPVTVALAATEQFASFGPRSIDEEEVMRHAIAEHEMRQED